MSIENAAAALPAYAKDLKLNLTSVVASTNLNEQQAWGTALASAVAARNPQLLREIHADAADKLSPAALAAAKAAAAIMGMNNIYYRFLHLSGDADMKTLPARLRMTVIGNPGVDKLDFELWSLAVSAINGCGMCIEAHEHEVKEKGASREMIQDAIRIAAVVHGAATALDAEAALN